MNSNSIGMAIYGDGSDGVVTISGTPTTLTRNQYYSQLTVPTGKSISTAAYMIFVRQFISIADANGINYNAPNPASFLAQNALAGAFLGGAAKGGNGSPSGGGAGASATNSLGGAGGAGGHGTGSLNGGAAGTVTAPATANGGSYYQRSFIGISSVISASTSQCTGGSGGGGGAGNGDTNQGGGGGGGGGVGWLIAQSIIGSGTFAMNGANGFSPASGVRGGGGAGGGGFAGTICDRSPQTTPTANGGTHGNAIGGGNTTNGGDGSAGNVYSIINAQGT